MAFANFIPQVWNAQMLLDFRAAATAAAQTNREYEGDARVGNQVKVTTAVDIAIKDYKAAGRETTPDPIDNTQILLPIDQEKSFDFQVDDIDRRQAAGSLDVYTQSAGISMALDADSFIFATAAAGADSGNKLTGTAPTTGDEAFDVVRDLRKALDKAKVPQASRSLFINAEFASLLVGADSKLTSFQVSGTTDGLRNATIGGLLNFQVIQSENLPTVDVPFAIAWYNPSVAFVSQIVETEAMRSQNSFADRLRGLHVYGAEVIRPVGVATWSVDA
ncbi:MAG: hypothetical protein FWD95_01835 [Nocardioidaceae bacterium]|nr:hypothetical protein [Nocardioidaceae bacterium]